MLDLNWSILVFVLGMPIGGMGFMQYHNTSDKGDVHLGMMWIGAALCIWGFLSYLNLPHPCTYM